MSSNAMQGGQALVEGFAAMLALAAIWVAVAWLGHLQDMALTAQHTSGHAAFAYTRNPASDVDLGMHAQHFTGAAHQWHERSGKSMLATPLRQVRFYADRVSALVQTAQPGGTDAMAVSLRSNWGIQDDGIVSASVQVLPEPETARAAGVSILGLDAFNGYPQLRRHTAILEGAGHASNDFQVQQTVAQSPLAWSDSAHASITVGKRVDAAMREVDAPWQRTHPVFDWLTPWAGRVPAGHLAHPAKEP